MTLHSSTACGHTEAALRLFENSANTDPTDSSPYDTGNIRLFYPVLNEHEAKKWIFFGTWVQTHTQFLDCGQCTGMQ